MRHIVSDLNIMALPERSERMVVQMLLPAMDGL